MTGESKLKRRFMTASFVEPEWLYYIRRLKKAQQRPRASGTENAARRGFSASRAENPSNLHKKEGAKKSKTLKIWKRFHFSCLHAEKVV